MQTTRYQQDDEAKRRLTEMGVDKNYIGTREIAKIMYEMDISTHDKVLGLMKNMQSDYGEHVYVLIQFQDTIGQHLCVLYVGQDTDNWQHEFSADNGVFRNEVLDIVVSKPELSRYTAIKCVCENGELKIIG